ncbi:MAG: nucleotidyltransferase domain-containing protein [Firmicutes bacterium]|jgi:predicted nucleotidyltransferase|nr:nucleotidyltransferase domain-containing protein [Bacillota bacterium]
MDQESVVMLTKKYAELVRQSMPVRQVILYGSYAKGTAVPDSDIDVAVIVDELDTDYLDQQIKLFKLRRSIDLRIEPVLIEYREDRSGFLKEIMQTGYVIYPPIEH